VSEQPLPIVPLLLFGTWLPLLLLGMTWGPQYGWASARLLAPVGISLAMGVVWVLIEMRSANPLLDLRVLASGDVGWANGAAFMLGTAMYGSLGFMPQFDQTPPELAGYGFGVSTAGAGLMLLPIAVCTFFGGLTARQLGGRRDRMAIAVGCAVSAGGLGVAAFAHEHPWQMYASGGLCGFGTGLAYACLSTMVVALAPERMTGVLAGANTKHQDDRRCCRVGCVRRGPGCPADLLRLPG
jgi:hypothetical protein